MRSFFKTDMFIDDKFAIIYKGFYSSYIFKKNFFTKTSETYVGHFHSLCLVFAADKSFFGKFI